MRRRPKSPRSTGELALIDRIRRRAAAIPGTTELTLGIGDDCAILQPQPGEDHVVTTDFCLEGRHWTRAWNPPASAGHRTLARGLSDLAAMGARPVAAFLSLALPVQTARDHGWLDAFLDGLLALAARHRVPLAGGDTSESPSPHVLSDIVCLGAVPHGAALRRATARPGDLLYCTGTLGGSFAERTAIAQRTTSNSEDACRLDRSAAKWRDPCITRPQRHETSSKTTKTQNPTRSQPTASHPFLYPEPRLAVGQALRERSLATACIDLSDGLSTDLRHLCEASGVAAEFDLANLPRSAWLRRIGAEERLPAMLHGGEDYELLFTAAPATRIPARIAGVRITRIGAITRRARSRPAIVTIGPTGRKPLEPQGWEHLK